MRYAYHVCSVYHENCCTQPLFATKAAALEFLGVDEQALTPTDDPNYWFTFVRSRDPKYTDETYTITRVPLRGA